MALPCSNSSLMGVVLILMCSCCWIQQCESKETVFQELEKHGFPVGLLPTSVKKYKLHHSNGKFKVYLYSACNFTVKDYYHIYYKKKLKGKIYTDVLKDLKGIKVKVEHFDIRIEKVLRVGEFLNFYTKSFIPSLPITDFDKSPECGCGLDCLENSPQLVQSA